jgi:NADH dehydrogenase FAD-containing subunit
MAGNTDVVVIGGGYAGVLAANRLTQRDDVTVTLINARSTFVERILLQDALDLHCDGFMTMERKLPTAAQFIERETGVRIMRPTTYWACSIRGPISTTNQSPR